MAEYSKTLEATVRTRTESLEEEIRRREQFQALLAQSEHYYRTLIESSNDLLVLVDGQGVLRFVSPSSETILGFPPDVLEGRNLYDFLHPDDLHFGLERFGEFIAGSTPKDRLEYRVRDNTGGFRILEASIRNLISDPSIKGLLMAARDITEKKKAEEMMRILQLAVEQNPGAIVITDPEGTIEYVNPRFERLTGYGKDEVLGKNPRILASGDTPPHLFAEMWATITKGEIWTGEFINQTKQGEKYEENVVIAPVKNTDGTIGHFVAMKENITELKKARREAEASSMAKTEFLSRVSHELRTPLNAINGFSQLLATSKKHPLDSYQLEYVLQINKAGFHLLDLINEILELSRIETGHMSLSIEAVDPAKAIHLAVSLLETAARERDVAITLEDEIDTLPAVRADFTRFKQIILNLLSNAVKYNKVGGSVTLSADVKEERVRILVADTGIGIAEEDQQELFVPFSRLGQDMGEVEGTGIGMTITKQLVELMRGEIGFSSTLGQGSLFWIELPRAFPAGQGEVAAPGGTPGSEEGPAPNRTITLLYVEEDQEKIQQMREMMAAWPDAALMVRKTAEKAVKAAGMMKPQVILIDCASAPDPGGDERLRLLRGDRVARGIPLLVAHGQSNSADVAATIGQGGPVFRLPPGYDLEQLKEAVTAVVEQGKSA